MTRVAFYKMHILILEFISPIYKMSIFSELIWTIFCCMQNRSRLHAWSTDLTDCEAGKIENTHTYVQIILWFWDCRSIMICIKRGCSSLYTARQTWLHIISLKFPKLLRLISQTWWLILPIIRLDPMERSKRPGEWKQYAHCWSSHVLQQQYSIM
jgi:hypothetical protein